MFRPTRLPLTLAELFVLPRQRFAEFSAEDKSRLDLAMRNKPKIAVGDVQAGLVDAYARALDVRLLDCFLAGWTKLSEIAAYADTSKYPPGEHHFVPLARHTISSRHAPKVEVLVDQVPVMEVPIEVAINAAFQAAVLDISGGRICGVRAGDCVITGVATCRGVTLAQVQALHYVFPGATQIDPAYLIGGGEAQAAGAPRDDRRPLNGAVADAAALTFAGADEGGRPLRISIPTAGKAGQTLTLGRNAQQVDIVISHATVSSVHARVRVTPSGVELCDLGSSNGTRVDGQRIGEAYVPIDRAKRIAFGSCEFSRA